MTAALWQRHQKALCPLLNSSSGRNFSKNQKKQFIDFFTLKKMNSTILKQSKRNFDFQALMEGMKAKRYHMMIALMIFSCFSAPLWAADWGFRGLLPRGTGYYDRSSIKKINQAIRQIWTVIIYNETGKEHAFSILKRQNNAPDNPAVLHQESTLIEFNCLAGKFRIVAFNIYDEHDRILLAVPEIHSAWNDVIPGSVNEKLKTIVCNVDETSKTDSK